MNFPTFAPHFYNWPLKTKFPFGMMTAMALLMAAVLVMGCNEGGKSGSGSDNDSTKVDSIPDTLRYGTERHFKNVGDKEILYASTHQGADTCPSAPPRKVEGKYVWPIYDTYDIYVADLKGNFNRQLTDTKGYDAEGTVSPDGKKIIFTSTRSGDLELWTMNIDGSDPRQLTNTLGYDGGAFFSPDNKKIVWRASRPTTPEDQKNYKDLLKKGLVEPSALEIFIANADGSDVKQVTNLGKANWAPSWHPSGNKIIFASNHLGETGRQFNLFLVNVDGSGLEQISFDETFDAFPVFSPDGKHVAFSSNRFNGGGHDTNVFLADWVE
jgi:TolB protein